MLKNLGEYFDESWIKNERFIFPVRTQWDYSRELKIEDVDLWEIIYDQSSSILILAAYEPYAEFYLIKNKYNYIESFYGPGSQNKMIKRAKEVGIDLAVKKIWVHPEDMWLYSNEKSKKTIFI